MNVIPYSRAGTMSIPVRLGSQLISFLNADTEALTMWQSIGIVDEEPLAVLPMPFAPRRTGVTVKLCDTLGTCIPVTEQYTKGLLTYDRIADIFFTNDTSFANVCQLFGGPGACHDAILYVCTNRRTETQLQENEWHEIPFMETDRIYSVRLEDGQADIYKDFETTDTGSWVAEGPRYSVSGTGRAWLLSSGWPVWQKPDGTRIAPVTWVNAKSGTVIVEEWEVIGWDRVADVKDITVRVELTIGERTATWDIGLGLSIVHIEIDNPNYCQEG